MCPVYTIGSVNIDSKVASFIASERIARLATADDTSRPHAIPICFAFDGSRIYTAIDLKPKRAGATQLKRVRNILQNPQVAVVIDRYSEDWSRLAYVLVQGRAAIVEDVDEQARSEQLLRAKYPQYANMLEPGSTVIRIIPENVVSWGDV